MKSVMNEYRNKLLQNEKDTYEAYLAKNGIRHTDIMKDAAADAKAEKALASADYGSLSEYLAKSGLSGSGYEDYIASSNEKEYRDKLLSAERASAESGGKNHSGYQKYVSDYNKLQAKISKSVIDSFALGKSFDQSEAFKKAIEAGLSEENATYTSIKAVRAAMENTAEEAINFAKLNGFSVEKAKEYAISLGLDGRYVDKVTKALELLSDEEKEFYSSMSPNEYYEYISGLAK